MRRKIALLIALVIVISISISYFIWFLYVHRKYERTIIRNTSNVEEANALTIAENSNYSDIFNLQRFTKGHRNETWSYTWANFIDTQVIEYYNDRFENLNGRIIGKPEGIKFHYEANIFAWDQIRVVYVPKGASRWGNAIQVLSLNGSVLFENVQCPITSLMKFAYMNDSEYQRITAQEINFCLSKGYVIEMMLDYDEIWGPLAGFIVANYQIIIVDQDFVPFLFCVQSMQGIS